MISFTGNLHRFRRNDGFLSMAGFDDEEAMAPVIKYDYGGSWQFSMTLLSKNHTDTDL